MKSLIYCNLPEIRLPRDASNAWLLHDSDSVPLRIANTIDLQGLKNCTTSNGKGNNVRWFFKVTLRRALAIREIESRPQTVLFEEYVPNIDTSKMELFEEPSYTERRITDNVFRFVQAFFGDRRIVVDLPNTVLAPSDAKQLASRGFDVDSKCGFYPLQKFYPISQSEEPASDLEFVWCGLWLLRSFPTSEIYTYE